MNKLTKRVLAFIMTVCMLTALVPAVVSAEAESSAYVIDFELDQNPELVWNNGAYGFGQTSLPHGNASWVTCFNRYYADGTINWSFPHTVGPDGKVVSELGMGSLASNPAGFGGTKYNNADSSVKYTGLYMQATSAGAGGAATGWNALVLRAPDAGIYNVALGYGQFSSGTNNNVYLLPYTDAMKTQVAEDIAAFNAVITAIVAQAKEAESYVGTFNSQSSVKEADGTTTAWVPDQSLDLGELTVGVDCDEYLLVISTAAGKRCYLQNMTFTPAAEEVIVPETVERNYSIKGTVTSNVNLNRTGTTETVEALYDAGTIDWSYLGNTALSTDTCQHKIAS